jgi:D-lactate dehydrogenase
MKIAFFSTQPYDKEYFTRYNNGHELIFFDGSLTEKTAELAASCNAVCIFVNDEITVEVIKKLAQSGVKLIAMRCAGYNNVNLQAAKENGLTVVRVPAYSPHAVAEHAVALIMTLNRKTHKAYNRVREGNFSLVKLTGFDLFEKTVGVIGTGKIGEVFATIMLGFGCKVLAYDVVQNENLLKKGVEYLPLEEIMRKADILSLHCPLNEKTLHLINDKTLSVMKKGAMIINTGRGKLIDTTAAIRHLKTGHLGYLGMDVYEQEEQLFFKNLSDEIIQDDLILRLMSFPNVLITAHQAFFTDEALTGIAQTTLQNISNFEKGVEPLNKV